MLDEKQISKHLKGITKSMEEMHKLLLIALFGQYPEEFETDRLGIKLPKDNKKDYIN